MNKLIEFIESGKQVGKSFSFSRDNKPYWSSIGIQKHGDFYLVYIDVIEESQMVAEKYEREEINKFSSSQDAVAYALSESSLKEEDLIPCKGQRIFNPYFGE